MYNIKESVEEPSPLEPICWALKIFDLFVELERTKYKPKLQTIPIPMLLNHIRKFFARPASKPSHTVESKYPTDMIVRRVKVNRARSPQEAIEATGRAQCLDYKVVKAMPRGEGDEVEVVFFKPDLSSHNGFVSDDELEKEFELRGLKPADPISVAAVNEADPAFADKKSHSTHWKDAKGNWCYATFIRSGGEREVNVSRDGGGWGDFWWFAGVRK